MMGTADLITIETERLCLRQWQAGDRHPFAALNADPLVMAYLPRVLDRHASDALAHRCESLIAERGWGLWAVEVREHGTFIGFVGLHVPTYPLPFSPCVEIGWRLARHYWGQGFATEAARGALTVGFDQLALPEVVAFTALGNARSRAVMGRLGMRASPTEFDHPALPPAHPHRTHCLYRLSHERWRAQCCAPGL